MHAMSNFHCAARTALCIDPGSLRSDFFLPSFVLYKLQKNLTDYLSQNTKLSSKKQNLGNFIKNVGQWDKLPKCGTNVGQNCKMWEMWECGTSVRPGIALQNLVNPCMVFLLKQIRHAPQSETETMDREHNFGGHFHHREEQVTEKLYQIHC